jgi:hypothetical protein
MTDVDREARLAALAARRTGGARSARPDPVTVATDVHAASDDPATRPTRSRRRHAALGGRLVAGALSVSAAVVFTAAMAQAARSTAPSAAPAPAPQATPIEVRVVLTNGQTSTAVTTPSAPVAAPSTSAVKAAAPAVTAAPAKAKATATSRAS